MGLLSLCQPILPRISLLTTYKTFIKSQLDYADVIHDQAFNFSILEKLKSLQYNAYQKNYTKNYGYTQLRLESRPRLREKFNLYKILNEKSLSIYSI